jgi:hypothetical protein
MAHDRKGVHGYIVANLTRGTFDGIYTADDPGFPQQLTAELRELYPGDLIVAAKLLDWPGAPFDQHFAHKVRWMNLGEQLGVEPIGDVR